MDMQTHARWRKVATFLFAALVLIGTTLFLRWPDKWDTAAAFADNGRGASIVYGADILESGGIPTLDSVETEPTGAAHLTWAIWTLGERAIAPLDRFAAFWAGLAVIGVLFTGTLLFGFASGFCAALLFACCAIPLDRMTLDPTTWALPLLVFCAGLATLCFRTAKRRWLVACGIVLGWAMMLDRIALLFVVAYILLFLFLRSPTQADSHWNPPRRRHIGYFLAGILLGLAPTALFYASRGALLPFLEQVFSVPDSWPLLWDEGKWSNRLDRLDEGLTGFWEFIALPTLWAALALAALPLRKQRAASPAGFLVLVFAAVATLVWIWGFRFPRTAYLLLLPSFCWIAAHPEGPLLRLFSRQNRLRFSAQLAGLLILLVVSLPGLYKQFDAHERVRSRRRSPSRAQREAARIGKKLTKRLPQDARIWVWGPDALSVYFHANRSSAIEHYKSAGLITTHRPNSWRTRRLDAFKKNSGPSEEIVAALTKAKPLAVVISRNASRSGFKSLADLLRKEYRRAREIGGGRDFDVYRQRDFRWLKPKPKPKNKAKRSNPSRKRK
jgi:hypothetical protein